MCDIARGPGVVRLRALTLSAVGGNDLPHNYLAAQPLRASRSQIPRFLVISNTRRPTPTPHSAPSSGASVHPTSATPPRTSAAAAARPASCSAIISIGGLRLVTLFVTKPKIVGTPRSARRARKSLVRFKRSDRCATSVAAARFAVAGIHGRAKKSRNPRSLSNVVATSTSSQLTTWVWFCSLRDREERLRVRRGCPSMLHRLGPRTPGFGAWRLVFTLVVIGRSLPRGS